MLDARLAGWRLGPNKDGDAIRTTTTSEGTSSGAIGGDQVGDTNAPLIGDVVEYPLSEKAKAGADDCR